MSRIILLTLFYARRMRGGMFLVIVLLVTVSILGNAATFYYFDGALNPDITVEDALWYSVISMTTIGYGDFSATTTEARLGTLVFIVLLGLAAFTLFLGVLTEGIATFIESTRAGMTEIFAKNHIIIVNYPSQTKLRQIIEEFRADPHHEENEIVVISDQIERLPFTMDRVYFCYGSPLTEEVFKRAHLDHAKTVLILSPDYSDPNSDAIVASIVQFIEQMYPDIHTIAECLDESHLFLFRNARCDSIVSGARISGNLLVQEMQDPGIAQMVRIITSNSEGTTVYTTAVGPVGDGVSYRELAQTLLDADVNLLAVNRGAQSHTSFRDLHPQEGDRLIYVADRRRSWEELVG